jgi:hypothetical protein
MPLLNILITDSGNSVVAASGVLPSPAPSEEPSPVLANLPIQELHVESSKEDEGNPIHASIPTASRSSHHIHNGTIEPAVTTAHTPEPGNLDILSATYGQQDASEEPSFTDDRSLNIIPYPSSASSPDFTDQSLLQQAARAEPPARPRIEIPSQGQERRTSQASVVTAQSVTTSPTVIMDAGGNQLRIQLQASEVNYEASMPSSTYFSSSNYRRTAYKDMLWTR